MANDLFGVELKVGQLPGFPILSDDEILRRQVGDRVAFFVGDVSDDVGDRELVFVPEGQSADCLDLLISCPGNEPQP